MNQVEKKLWDFAIIFNELDFISTMVPVPSAGNFDFASLARQLCINIGRRKENVGLYCIRKWKFPSN